MEPVVEVRSITDFLQDCQNANVGTERGMALLDKSISTDGAGRSLLATKDGVIIAGNKTQQALIDQGIEEVIVVHTDGTRAVIVQRDDVEHGTERAQRMAVFDNRSSEVGLDWSPEILASLDIDLGEMFFENELMVLGITSWDYSDFDAELADLAGCEDVDILITVPAKHKEFIVDWLANGETKSGPGLGKGVMRRCGLL